MQENTKDLSFESLINFLDWAASKGHLKESTAKAQKAACNQVFGILDEEEKEDISKVKIDTVFDRYKNLSGQSLNPDSLKAYRSRLQKALEGFLSYKKDPEHWKPPIAKRSRSRKSPAEKAAANKADLNFEVANQTMPLQLESEKLDDRLVYPFPLRAGVTVRIVGLPTDLKVLEAKRLGTFLLTLAEDYNPSDS